MARAGGFGSGGRAPTSNPFGGGSLSGLSQYDVGQSLRDIARYEAEVKWGNGDLSDADYLAVLHEQLAATTAGTQEQIAAQNKIEDVTYRIGRQKATDAGLDQLIAFDQSSIASMNKDNLRYRDIADSLDSEMAQRRSRDYGKLVTDYNNGKGSTESLLAYAKKLQGSLSANAPDKDNWDNVVSDLTDRVATEKDSQVYQDYQDRKIKPDAFLAYVQGRRDGFGQDTPKWDEWNRKYDDAQRNVKDTAQAAADNALFNKYNEGKVSDKTYLKYLSDRIAGMDPGDPQKAEWQHRLNTATFSLAEDQLTFDVKTGKRPLSTLTDFYRHYRTTLNPGSAEWRSITEKIMSITGSGSGGGIGGGGSSAKGQPASSATGGKVITTNSSLGTWLAALTPNLKGSPASQKTTLAFLNANYASLTDARTRGDKTFKFLDPTHPGKFVMLPVSDQAMFSLDGVKANYYYGLAQQSLAAGKPKDFAANFAKGMASDDHARGVNAQHVVKDATAQLDAINQGIDYYTNHGDAAGVVNLIQVGLTVLGGDPSKGIKGLLDDPTLPDSTATKLETMANKLADNPLFPRTENGKQVGGLVDYANSPKDADGNLIDAILPPNVHFTIDGQDKSGMAVRGWEAEPMSMAPGEWAQTHVTVRADIGGDPVTGEVTVHPNAPTRQTVTIRTKDGLKTVLMDVGANYISYLDGSGQRVQAYSIDGGQTWLQSTGGMLPTTQIGGGDLIYTQNKDGSVSVADGQGNLVMKSGDGKTFTFDPSWAATTGSLQWQSEINNYVGFNTGVGGVPGARLVRAGSDGSIDFAPPKPVYLDTVALKQARADDASLPTPRGTGSTLKNLKKAPVPYLDVAALKQTKADEAAMGTPHGFGGPSGSGVVDAAVLSGRQQSMATKLQNADDQSGVIVAGQSQRPVATPPAVLPKITLPGAIATLPPLNKPTPATPALTPAKSATPPPPPKDTTPTPHGAGSYLKNLKKPPAPKPPSQTQINRNTKKLL